MTEAEWLGCADPRALLAVVTAQATDRKMRLFLWACCARVLDATPPQRRLFRGYYDGSFRQLQHALSLVEQFAEGLVGADALAEARRDAADSAYVPPAIDYGGETEFGYEAATVLAAAADHPVPEAVLAACWRATEAQAARLPAEEARWQTLVCRDIFGNPFRPVHFAADWRTATARALAQQMYAARDFSPMPILGDALEDAGCANAEILAHCRNAGEHVRGCWVLDLVIDRK